MTRRSQAPLLIAPHASPEEAAAVAAALARFVRETAPHPAPAPAPASRWTRVARLEAVRGIDAPGADPEPWGR